ncbi:hypothetical protein K788_0007321 (plasmid) [Paraburkholderia caribensis MBA4]|uniref:Uncharacterized protein n=1 Tax=Paraburkholderia caribensis MBA4 TaxID=1323664 RepID=A0A0P0RS46_9BURK|nr:hypothetical protein K788_0007321 [Paraburkholderia caribensis MBA4]
MHRKCTRYLQKIYAPNISQLRRPAASLGRRFSPRYAQY